MILKNLWRRKTRTLLTLLGIAVGVAAVVALSAFGEGIASGMENMFSATVADLTVGQKDAMMLMFSSVDEGLGDDLQQIEGVAQAAGTVVGVVQMPEAPYFIVMGEDPRGFAMAHYRLIAGGPITGRKQILLGKVAAKNFKKEVGETFHVNGLSYRVVGIYETGLGLEDGGAVMGLEDAQRSFGKRDKVTYFVLKLKDARRMDAVKEEIEARWPDLSAARSGDATRQDEFLGLYRSFGLFVGVFAALVGGLGMMNTTLMSVLERTREIGVLRAMGWGRGRVVGMILGEALVLAAAGGGLGVALGLGLIALTKLSPAVESLLQGVVTPSVLMQGMGIALVLGAIGGLYPAWRAAQLAPIEAMRYEGGAGGGSGRTTQLLARLRLTGGALRNLSRRPARTLVTLAGIGLGVGFIVALIAMTDGMTATFNQLASAGQMDLVAEQAKASDLSLSEIDDRAATRLRAHPEVKSVSRILFGFPNIPGVPFMFIFGLDPQEQYIQHFRIREGRMATRSGEILLGRFAADNLEKGVGDTLRFSGTTFKIVGIYENGSTYEDGGGMMLLKDAQRVFGKPRKASLLGIQLKDPSRGAEVARALEAQFPELMVGQASGFIQRLQDFATMYAIFNTLVVVTVIVGGIVMTNAMLMSVFERTQEIGVLRALGWRRGRIVGMVLAESLALSLLSGLVGIAVGVGLNQLFLLIPDFGAFLIPVYSQATFAKVLVLALGLGSVGGLYPAWRAAGLRPIEALKYE
jgi:ABC-type antimicrobial peptide transport system permease subunit